MTKFPDLIMDSDHYAIGFVYECPIGVWRGYSYLTKIGEGFSTKGQAIEFVLSEGKRAG